MELDTWDEGDMLLPSQQEPAVGPPSLPTAHGFGKLDSILSSHKCHLNYPFTFRSLKRENPNLNEDVVLIRALRDSNLPKFLTDDAVLFR